MATLFGKAKSTINEHIKNIYEENELSEAGTMKKFGISEFQQKAPNFHNLDMIISVGYHGKSLDHFPNRLKQPPPQNQVHFKF